MVCQINSSNDSRAVPRDLFFPVCNHSLAWFSCAVWRLRNLPAAGLKDRHWAVHSPWLSVATTVFASEGIRKCHIYLLDLYLPTDKMLWFHYALQCSIDILYVCGSESRFLLKYKHRTFHALFYPHNQASRLQRFCLAQRNSWSNWKGGKKKNHTILLSQFSCLFQLANIKTFSPGLYNLLKY